MKVLTCLFAISLFLLVASCSKEERNGFVTPPSANTLKAPIARAGNDTTIFPLISTYNLKGFLSNDPDGNIASYKWRYLGSDSNVSILLFYNVGAIAFGLVNQGIYEFELKVTDNDSVSSRDTVKITVGSAACNTSLNEILLQNVEWNEHFVQGILLFLDSLLPPASKLKKIFIKRDFSSNWEEVTQYNPNNPNSYLYTWIDNGTTIGIYPKEDSAFDTPDLRIVYCN